MHTMHDEVQLFSDARPRFVMEKMAVDEVFEQRPNENAEQK